MFWLKRAPSGHFGDNEINAGLGTQASLGTGDTNDNVITNLTQLPGDKLGLL